MSERSVGLIGLGAIGREVAARLTAGAAGPVSLTALVRRPVADLPGVRCVTTVEALMAARPQLVVEAAGHAAVAAYGPTLLAAGIPMLIASVGALADAELYDKLKAAARQGGTRLIRPSGAIGGIDYLEAVSDSAGLRVRYCSRKPPAAWKQELKTRGIDADGLATEVVLFEGSARQAALLFPQNLNVAATLALAGVGIDATEVRVVADPKAKGNTHEIEIASAAGTARMTFENNPSPANPKTSALTALSIVRAAREALGHSAD